MNGAWFGRNCDVLDLDAWKLALHAGMGGCMGNWHEENNTHCNSRGYQDVLLVYLIDIS